MTEGGVLPDSVGGFIPYIMFVLGFVGFSFTEFSIAIRLITQFVGFSVMAYMAGVVFDPQYPPRWQEYE